MAKIIYTKNNDISELSDFIEAVNKKTQLIDFNNLSDEEFTNTIRALYGPPQMNKKQKDYWCSHIHIIKTDFINDNTTIITYSNNTSVTIDTNDWLNHYNDIYKMTLNEVIRTFAIEVNESVTENMNNNNKHVNDHIIELWKLYKLWKL